MSLRAPIHLIFFVFFFVCFCDMDTVQSSKVDAGFRMPDSGRNVTT